MARTTQFVRHDGRQADELRQVSLTPNFVGKADGSCLIEMGGTRVICTASIVPGVPAWRQASGQGWMTAEYGMLPASTGSRKPRPLAKPDGRSVEIQRLIGRVLRNVVRLEELGPSTLYLDCDVLEADGGTRTAAITGAYVALHGAVAKAAARGQCSQTVLAGRVAAVSAGLVDGHVLLDLDYSEDSQADVDMNVAMNDQGEFLDVQASGERRAFGPRQMAAMMRLARQGIGQLLRLEAKAIGQR